MESKEASISPELEAHTTPYESPIIVLSVGPKDDNPVLFHVHKEKLIHIPFFKAAFRENAFAEGHQGEINFKDGDPIVFRRVVEFIYEGDCFPRQKLLPEAVTIGSRDLVNALAMAGRLGFNGADVISDNETDEQTIQAVHFRALLLLVYLNG
ncbi:hypothetical protein VE03_10363 [Pseudogymnoascus sp. 23342-1-I1]|nr:hypothetical protein VE03_10363 [Pseudogymnoascus sp. 23342-1-I1]